ncbi:MAG TPA: amidohydrolase [Solimonas sp.]|nr:amidohydrolase [Solimonas sp.]
MLAIFRVVAVVTVLAALTQGAAAAGVIENEPGPPALAPGAAQDLQAEADRSAGRIEPKVIAHRRQLHQHPELGNREFETAKYIARELKALGIEVQTGVAHTGVVGVLRGALPGPVVALRADMDALPVAEEVDLPFASKVRAKFDGKDVGVMHACGHDAHVGILLGTAEVLAGMKARLPGTVKFIFQPAEEGAPDGEDGGAELMVREGVLRSEPKPEVIFGLHVFSEWDAGQLKYRAGGAMASAEDLEIRVRGKQTHGASPWKGIDPIVVSAQVVLGLQTIASRQMELTRAPVIVTIGKIEGGVRNNIIPDEVTMKGTLRALDTAMQQDLHERVHRTAENIAAASGATATVTIGTEVAYPVTYNDPALVARLLPTLQRVAGAQNVAEVPPIMGAEDFSFYAREIPGFFVFVGARPPGESPDKAAANHSPRFHIDESALKIGVRTLSSLTLDYLQHR